MFGHSVYDPLTGKETFGVTVEEFAEMQESTMGEVHLVGDDKLNYTDPIVRHDIDQLFSVAMMYDPEYSMVDADKKHTYQQEYDQARVFAKKIPVVKLNNIVLKSEQIKYLKIDYKDFVPTLTLYVIDDNGMIDFKDRPSRKSVINVVIVPQAEGAYKKISLEFSITKVPEKHGNILRYLDCQLNLRQLYAGSPKTYNHPGCSSDRCKTEKTNTPNIYEFFHDVALELGLGFQATEMTKEVEDRLPRNSQNFRLHEFMKNQIKLAGLNEENIMDAWIDLYGYLTLVNVKWIMSQDIDHTYLSIKGLFGPLGTSETTPEPTYKLVNRTINNFRSQNTISNLMFDSYDHIDDFEDLMTEGTVKNIFEFNRSGDEQSDGTVGENNLSQINIQARPSSMDESDVEKWNTETSTIILTETNAYPTGRQQELRKTYFTSLRTKTLKVKMRDYNLGLQRGTLINFVAFTYDTIQKQKLIDDGSAIGDPKTTKDADKNDFNEYSSSEVMLNDAIGLADPSVSGIYYIDGMEFIYDSKNQEIEQYLYIIPKGPTNTVTNSESLPSYNVDDEESYAADEAVASINGSDIVKGLGFGLYQNNI